MKPEKVLRSTGISRSRAFSVGREAGQMYFVACLTWRRVLTPMEILAQYFPRSLTHHCIVLSEVPHREMHTTLVLEIVDHADK